MPTKLQLNDIKQLQLDILVAFDELCKEHGLRYFLAYGTLIGAVRHKGYIPWDDDIDIQMPHKDFLKLVQIANEKNNGGMLTDRYRLADARVDSDIPYHQTFAKIYDMKTTATASALKAATGFQEGVFIDIFTVSGIPASEEEHRRVVSQLRFYNDMAYYSSRQMQLWELNPLHPRRFLTNLQGYIKASKHSTVEWTRLYAKLVDTLPSCDETEVAYDIKARLMAGDNYLLHNNPWSPIIPGEFEGREFPIPAQYDELLTAFYGDYMKLPPVEQQQPTHDQDYYLL